MGKATDYHNVFPHVQSALSATSLSGLGMCRPAYYCLDPSRPRAKWEHSTALRTMTVWAMLINPRGQSLLCDMASVTMSDIKNTNVLVQNRWRQIAAGVADGPLATFGKRSSPRFTLFCTEDQLSPGFYSISAGTTIPWSVTLC